MNILFFLSPKQDLMYVYDDFTLRQTLEKWEDLSGVADISDQRDTFRFFFGQCVAEFH